MRLTASFLLAGLPLLVAPAAAAEDGGVFAQYRARVGSELQSLLGSVSSLLNGPVPAADNAAAAGAAGPAAAGTAAAKAAKGAKPVVKRPTVELTLSNWKDTLYAPVKPEATVPEEWWLLITGGNKTCFGHCGKVEAAYNVTAAKLSTIPDGPHTAILNCDKETVLCNSWAASAGFLYVIELLPKPAKVDIYYKRLNMTTTTPESIMELYTAKSKEPFTLHEVGMLHPFDGSLTTKGLALPLGYLMWLLNILPSWLMMLVVSFVSRSMMGRRMGQNRPTAAAPAAAPAAAR